MATNGGTIGTLTGTVNVYNNLMYNTNLTGVAGAKVTLSGNITGDPLFIDRTNENYNLKSTSPAKSAGVLIWFY